MPRNAMPRAAPVLLGPRSRRVLHPAREQAGWQAGQHAGWQWGAVRGVVFLGAFLEVFLVCSSGCSSGVPRVFLGCTSSVPRVFLECSSSVSWGVPRVSLGVFLEVFLGCTSGVPRVFLGVSRPCPCRGSDTLAVGMAPACTLDLLAVIGALLLVCLPGCWPLRIGQLQVPSLIRNGSVSDVVLDCDYSLEPGEKADGMVVKWFLNYQSNPLPVYQWIPNHIPQDLGLLRGRLNLGYRATDEPATRHRALNILNPTIELSGEYRCLVSTFYGEDTKSKKMVVYVPEDSLELTQSRATEEGQVRLSCEADGVFPRPELTFIHKETGKVLDGAAIRVTDRKDGLYDIEADIQVEDAPYEDGAEHTFGCELSIPEANYTLTEWETYESNSSAAELSRLSLPVLLAALAVLAGRV